jgi:hypothetical protein
MAAVRAGKRRKPVVSGAQRQMPRRRGGHTTAVTIGAERFYLTANQRHDGSLGEVFIHWGKHGTSGAGLLATFAVALSIGLRHRVPLAELIRPGLGQRFAPSGPTDDPDIPSAYSAVDYIARRLALDWLPYRDRAVLGIYTLTERRPPDGAGRPGLTGQRGAAGQQAEAHHLERLADRRGEVQAHGGQFRIGLVSGQHRGGWLGVRPQGARHHHGGAGQLHRVLRTEFGYAAQHQDAERGDRGQAGPLVSRRGIR